jgi:hypothetical protein
MHSTSNNPNKIGLFGGCFQHAYSSTLWKTPKHFEWAKNTICNYNCFVEDEIVKNIHNPVKKFAWVVESSPIIEKYHGTVSNIIAHAKEISDSYDFLISHDKKIYSLAPNFYYLPPHGTWIENPTIHPKTKLCSMITSNKRMVDGHNLRLNWAERLKGKVDLFGRGIRPFDRKEDVLNDYMFSITIENTSYETYWTEKILDCFATGTIPIYLGAPDIGNYFNMDGIILLTDDFDTSCLSSELYISKQDAIIDNFERALQYDVIEDIIWNRFIKK